MKIDKIIAREILDSRGNPTISTTIFLDNGKYYFASVPSGASTGSSEAYELRDRDMNRYGGMGVLKAVNSVNKDINNLLIGKDIENIIELDKQMIELDGSENKMNLGANAILSVSLALNRACADYMNMPLYKFINEYYKFIKKPQLPTPLVNVINGGKHADSNLDFQEFWIVPDKVSQSFKEKLRACSEVFHALGEILSSNDLDTDVGNEGGYSPDFEKTENAWDFIQEAIKKSDYENKFYLGLDAGSSTFFNNNSGKYFIKLENLELTKVELLNYYMDWIKKYPIKYFEDPFAEEDWNSWKDFYNILSKIQGDAVLIGDDLFTTNVNRLQRGVELQCANAILIKPNQIGTISETTNCIKLAQENNFKVAVSHRSGETCDDFIADLSVAVSSDYIKTGSISRGERISKYNRLLAIEEELL